MSFLRCIFNCIFTFALILASSSTSAEASSPQLTFTAEQQLAFEKYTNGIDSRVVEFNNSLTQLEQRIEADSVKQELKNEAQQMAIDSQLKLFKLQNETKNTSLTLAKSNLEVSRNSVDRWLGLLSLLLAAAAFFVWRMRETIQLEWNNQKEQIEAEHDKAIQDIDRSKKILIAEVKECLVEARERIKELREELRHARAIKGQLDKIHDAAAEVMRSDKHNAVEQVERVIQKNKAKADESAQSALVAKAMELEQENKWDEAAIRWLALTDLDPTNADYWFNYAYALEGTDEADINTLEKVCNAYNEVTVINSQHEFAYSNWASALLKWTSKLSGDERELKLVEAEFVAKTLLDKFPYDTYNLACVRSLQNKTNEARELLIKGQGNDAFPSLNHLNDDADLDNLRGLTWFQDLLGEINKQSEEAAT